MQKHIKNILKWVLAFQLALAPVAKASLDFDFGDDGSVVTPGEDRDERHEDGNCVGSGCDDRGAHGVGHDDDDNDGAWQGNGVESDSVGDHSGHDRHNDRNDSSDRPGSHSIVRDSHEIAQGDRDRGDGVIFVRDRNGNIYYRGESAKFVDDEQGGYYTGDHTDIYSDHQGVDFVKSKDGTHLLPLEGLKECVATDTCRIKGYREDWWQYSYRPSLNDSDEASDWSDKEQFYQEQLRLDKLIDKAYTDPKVRSSNEKYRVMKVTDHLLKDARSAYVNERKDEALALQHAVKELAVFFADVGIAVSPLGWAKDAYELITGTHLITGKPLSDSERIIAGLGVVMPGVGSLAIAGIYIVKDIKNGEKSIEGVLQIERALEELGLKAARFKEGTNLSEVAIIGRDMESVRAMEVQLKSAGVETITFEISDGARNALKKDFIKNGNKNVPYEQIPLTEAYRENMSWVQKILNDDISVIDIGNPKGIKEPSRFYDDEIRIIFRGK